MPWEAHVPFSMKKNIVINEFRRAIRNSTEETRSFSIEKIKIKFHRNGYPTSVLNKFLNIAEEVKHNNDQISVNKPRRYHIRLPFVDNKHKRKVYELLRRTHLSNCVRPIFTNPPLRRILDKRPSVCSYENCVACECGFYKNQCNVKNCIYLIECMNSNCHKIYIGETSRTIRSRINEHLKRNDSEVFQHLVTHEVVSPNVIRWKILHKGLSNSTTRKLVEEKEIKARPPQLLINANHVW